MRLINESWQFLINNKEELVLRFYVLPVVFLLFFTLQAKAQNVQPINLETVLELGGANSLIIQEYRQQQELALAGIAKAKEWWLPEVYAGIQTHQLWGGAMNSDGRFFLDVNRSNLWAGLGLDAKWDFADGIYQTKASKLKAQAAQFQTQAARNQSLLDIIDTYYDFTAAQLYYVAYEQLASQADTISKQIDIQVKSGLQYESELLLSKSNVNHLIIQMLHAKAEYKRQSAALVKLLNLDPKAKLVSVDSVMSPLNLTLGNTSLDEDLDSAYQNRPEFKATALNLKSLEIEKKTITTGLLIPELRLNTYGSYFGDLNSPVSPMFPDQYPEPQQLYPTGALNVGLMWKIPLSHLTYGGDVKQFNSRISVEQTHMEQLKAKVSEEVVNAQETLQMAKEQMEIASEGSQFAEEAVRQSMQRQQLGTVRPLEMLQAQEIYLRARLDYLKAVADYNKAQYQLYVTIGNNL